MNLTGNLLGYRTGYPPGYPPGYLDATRPDTDSVSTPITESGSEPPHVRAIASRPGPSRPFQTLPGGLDHPPKNRKNKTAKTLSSVSAGVARERTHTRARGAHTKGAACHD